MNASARNSPRHKLSNMAKNCGKNPELRFDDGGNDGEVPITGGIIGWGGGGISFEDMLIIYHLGTLW